MFHVKHLFLFPGEGEATDALIDGIQGEGTVFLLCGW